MQPDLAEAVRPASCRALAARRTSDWACPTPSLRCTLHIGCSTTCDRDSTVLPWPPTDVPKPSGQQGCRIYPETPTGCKRTPFGAVTSIRSHDVHMVHAHATRQRCSRSEAEQPALRSHVPCANTKRSTACRLAKPARIGRQRLPCAQSRVRASLWARAALPKYAGFGDSVRRAQQVNIKMD